MTDDGGGMVWLNSEVMPDGSYVAAVAFDDDTSIALPPAAAVAYALGVLDAAERADYDAAVIAQLTASGDRKSAIEFLAYELRPKRAELRSTGTALTLTPGVSQRSGEPFLTVTVRGKDIGQWTVPAAREHALYALAASVAAGYDAEYHGVLVRDVGVEDGVARAAVGDIARYRVASDG